VTNRPTLIAVVSDLHANSTIGLCPPEGVQLDDAGFYHPSKSQSWLWDCWEDYWQQIKARQKAAKADLIIVCNGDAVDGDHHQTSQIISRNMEVQGYVASRVFDVPLALSPSHLFIVRGTEVHVGPSGSSEEALAKSLKAERSTETQNWSHWELPLLIHGCRLNFQHHASVGGLPWTKPGAIARLAFRIWVDYLQRGEDAPHLAIRSHLHNYMDSYGSHPTRAIITPAWQLKTAHAHKVVPESIADIGGLAIMVDVKGGYQVDPILYRPARPQTWRKP